MIKVVLVDDEFHALNTLQWEIENHCDSLKVVATFQDPQEAVRALPVLKPDLVFLDIEMPVMNGFDLLDELTDISFDLIFVTAYDQYAVQAFRINAVDYLLKPVSTDDLLEAVRRFRVKRLSASIEQDKKRNLINQLRLSFNKIPLPQLDRMEFVLPDEIFYCKSDGSYVEVILEKRKVLITKSLKEMEGKLSDRGFYRVHKSYLVNLHHIKEYLRGEGGYLVMGNGDQVPVARRKKEELMKLF